MDLAAEHVGFVLVSYGLSALALAALAIWIIWRDRKARAALRSLEKN